MGNVYLEEDVGLMDITTLGLGIGACSGVMEMRAKESLTLSGCAPVKEILQHLGLAFTFDAHEGEAVRAGERILHCIGSAKALHQAWKVSQNLLEHLSGVASYTKTLVQEAKRGNPAVEVATTRKHFPGTKKMMLTAVLSGGASPHRLGLYDSVLVFAQHRVFLGDKEALARHFWELKQKFLEKKVAVEVENFQEALYFARIGADILQCEKMGEKELKRCVELKEKFPHVLISATGGINVNNAQATAACGVDLLVTSSPYFAKPKDVKVTMQPKEKR